MIFMVFPNVLCTCSVRATYVLRTCFVRAPCDASILRPWQTAPGDSNNWLSNDAIDNSCYCDWCHDIELQILGRCSDNVKLLTGPKYRVSASSFVLGNPTVNRLATERTVSDER